MWIMVVAAFDEYPPNEQAAMAVGRVFLAAKQGHTETLYTGLKAVDGRLEARDRRGAGRRDRPLAS